MQRRKAGIEHIGEGFWTFIFERSTGNHTDLQELFRRA